METRLLEDVEVYNFRNPSNEMRKYGFKVIIMAMLPIMIAVSSYGAWWVILKYQGNLKDLHGRFIATLVFLLFLIHPAITKRMVDVWNCSDYDGMDRLLIDTQTVCF